MKRLTLFGIILILLLGGCADSGPATGQPATATTQPAPAATTDGPAATATEESSGISSAGFIATVTAAARGDDASPTEAQASRPSPTSEAIASPTPEPAVELSPTTEPLGTDSPTDESETDDVRGPITVIEVRGGAPGEVASATVEVTLGTRCELSYTTPSGTESQASGLGEAVADEDGRITWEWVIGSRTNPGEGTVMVRCGDATESRPITIG